MELFSRVEKIGELVAEIAAASKEQSEGINQVNKAVADMDSVAQQNAANAEESASAAEEMNAQTETLKAMVKELNEMVGEGKTALAMFDTQALPESKKSIHQLMLSKYKKSYQNNKRAVYSQGSLPDPLGACCRGKKLMVFKRKAFCSKNRMKQGREQYFRA
jgi:ABC-type transporter Mla subunit MlaD